MNPYESIDAVEELQAEVAEARNEQEAILRSYRPSIDPEMKKPFGAHAEPSPRRGYRSPLLGIGRG